MIALHLSWRRGNGWFAAERSGQRHAWAAPCRNVRAHRASETALANVALGGTGAASRSVHLCTRTPKTIETRCLRNSGGSDGAWGASAGAELRRLAGACVESARRRRSDPSGRLSCFHRYLEPNWLALGAATRAASDTAREVATRFDAGPMEVRP